MDLVLRDEFIKLGQALKAAGIAESGVDAKERILNEEVLVNGEVCTMRGKKLVAGDVVTTDGEEIHILPANHQMKRQQAHVCKKD